MSRLAITNPPLVPLMSTCRVAEIWPIHVLICVENAGVSDLIGLLLADAGCIVINMDVAAWLLGDAIPGLSPDVLILDAWPLRHAAAAAQAHTRLAAQPTKLILLMDNLQPSRLADQLGAVATLPLLFTLQNLVNAVQRST